MVKKLVSVLLLVSFAVAIVSVSCAESISPYAVTACNIATTISISSGNVQVACSISKIPSGFSTKATVVLQKKSGNSWISVTSASGNRSASASASATKGITYRSYATCKLYDSTGAYVDSISATSTSKTY